MAITDLTGYTWVGNSNVTVTSAGVRTYNINYSITCDNTQYNSSGGTLLEIGFTQEYYPPSDQNRSVAYIEINTDNYAYFGGTFFQENGRIYESHYGATIPATLNLTVGCSPTYVTSIIITGGTDVTNADLIAWLEANGTLTPSSSPSTADKLQDLIDIKQDIKEAIENKGADLTGVAFGGYAGKIDEIPLPKEEQTKTVSSPNFSSGNVVVTPDSGKVLTQVTVVKDSNLVPENIVKDVNIFGVVGTAETGGTPQGETWVINESPNFDNFDYNISFISNERSFNHLFTQGIDGGYELIYEDTETWDSVMAYGMTFPAQIITWRNQAYRTITFETEPTGDLLTWLQANAIKQ